MIGGSTFVLIFIEDWILCHAVYYISSEKENVRTSNRLWESTLIQARGKAIILFSFFFFFIFMVFTVHIE